MSEIIQPKPLVDALDGIFGYLDALTPYSNLTDDADCPDKFPLMHAHFAGQVATRDEFPYFDAWIDREQPDLSAIFDRLEGPRIITLN